VRSCKCDGFENGVCPEEPMLFRAHNLTFLAEDKHYLPTSAVNVVNCFQQAGETSARQEPGRPSCRPERPCTFKTSRSNRTHGCRRTGRSRGRSRRRTGATRTRCRIHRTRRIHRRSHQTSGDHRTRRIRRRSIRSRNRRGTSGGDGDDGRNRSSWCSRNRSSEPSS
jgi:hypothetical protein